jgi:predicted DsbA family dithiol-disulfide isomerase
MRDFAQSNPDKLNVEDLVKAAGDLKINKPAFRQCLADGKYASAVKRSSEFAQGIGATGTPSFVLGKTTEHGTHGELIEGALPYVDFVRAIAKLEPGEKP